MRPSNMSAFLLFLLAVAPAMGFVPQLQRMTYATIPLQMVELVPEPEGGEELTAKNSMPGSRMKDMGEVTDVKSDDGTPHSFWLQATTEGTLIKDLNTQVMKDAKKKANFPGFRKGQIPPYALPQIRGFAVQEGIIQTCQAAVEAYGLKSLPGSKGEVEVLEDVPEMANTYKLGDDLQFTATLKATYVPEEENKEEPPATEAESS